MFIYTIDTFYSKLSTLEKIEVTQKYLKECGLKIGYLLFDTFQGDTFSEQRQEKLISIIGAPESCKFITYPHFKSVKHALLITDPEKVLSEIKDYPHSFFRGLSSVYLGDIKHVEESDKKEYIISEMTNGSGYFAYSINFNIRYYKTHVTLDYPLPAEDDRFNSFVKKLKESAEFRFDYPAVIPQLTEEEEKIPVNIPKLKNSEKYEGIFRYEPNKNYNTGEKVRTNLSSALNKALTPELREKLTITGKGTSIELHYRNKENHYIRVVMDNSTAGKAAYKNSGWISPVATFGVFYKGVNFSETLCSRFCHNTSQEVLNDFIKEGMQFLTEIIEETDSFADKVTELKTPSYCEFYEI
ncbi:MAG: hypothetical protein E7634_08900 [Ruminococcaceae bacterium]|nr:hypothetical protein [Oscillospiraceae bacterium]